MTKYIELNYNCLTGEKMSIKIISINPDAIYSAEKNILKLEEKTNNNIKKIHDAVVDCYDEIDIASAFLDNIDKDINNYIDKLKAQAKEYEKKEKTAIKELKKKKKKKKYIYFIKKFNY